MAGKEQYFALYQIAQEKLRHDKALDNYYKLPALRRLFTPRPRDLFPQVSYYQVTQLFDDAFMAAHPELNKMVPGADGPASFDMRFSISINNKGELYGRSRVELPHGGTFGSGVEHTETKEFREGYGLVDTFQHDPDNVREIANRNYAWNVAYNNRPKDDLFKSFYKEVDRICDNEAKELNALKNAKVTNRQQLTRHLLAAQTEDATRRNRAQGVSAICEKYMKNGGPTIKTVSDFLMLTRMNKDITRMAMSGEYNRMANLFPSYLTTQESLKVAESVMSSNRTAIKRFYDNVLHDEMLKMRPSGLPKADLAVLLEIAEQTSQNRVAPKTPSEIIREFAYRATLAGYGEGAIKSKLLGMDEYRSIPNEALTLDIEKSARDAKVALCENFLAVMSSEKYAKDFSDDVNRPLSLTSTAAEVVSDIWFERSAKDETEITKFNRIAEAQKKQPKENEKKEIKVTQTTTEKELPGKKKLEMFPTVDGTVSIRTKEGNWLSVDAVSAEKDGIHVVKKAGKFNYMKNDGNLLCETWLDAAGEFKDGKAKCKLGNAILEIDKTATILDKKIIEQQTVKSEVGMKLK